MIETYKSMRHKYLNGEITEKEWNCFLDEPKNKMIYSHHLKMGVSEP